jgi:hypothetical protein
MAVDHPVEHADCSSVDSSSRRVGVGKNWLTLLGASLLSGQISASVVALVVWRQTPESSIFALPEIPLQATATDSNESFAAATNMIDEDAEGLFLLDCVTGQLQCVVLSHRTAKFNALFQANVALDLALGESGKNAKLLLVTGSVNFRGSANARPASSVAYVIDTTSGKYAAYGVPWRRDVANQGRAQSAPMALLHVGSARAPNITIEE